jgi:multidrug transporter EmrE-like cation transporter
MTPGTLAYILCGVCLNAVAQLALKAATRQLGVLSPGDGALLDMGLRIAAQPLIWTGLFCYGLSVLAWIVALSRTDVSIAYPFLSIGYVITALAAWQLFGEALSPQRVGAIALICVGVVLLYRS